MSKSQAVKDWRNRTKQRIIDAMGGSCVCCGYNRCTRSLALHHINPDEKDFSFGAIRASPKSWSKIVVELRKCVLVCHNCHNEIHEGMLELPDNPPRFNEDYVEYKKFKLPKELMSPCKMCGKLKAKSQIYCSLSCSGKATWKVDWESIDLFEELKSKSKVQVAKELGCSEAAVRKRIKKLGQ